MRAPVNSFGVSTLRSYSPGGVLNALAAALRGGNLPTLSTHRLRHGLPGYLILFATHAFEPQRQLQTREPPSPTGVLPYIYAFHRYHMEFHSPLLHSRKTVSDAVPRLSRGLSHQTYSSACARFTPNKSGQTLCHLRNYRGCWHVVSRDFLVDYRQIKDSYYLYPSSPTTELYDPKTFFTHAALLHQTCVHCGRFPTACLP